MTDGLDLAKRKVAAGSCQPIQCDGKTKFKTFTEAARRSVKYEGKRRVHLQPYHCGRCHNWHVGN